jgi:photosystem II protein
VLQFVRGVDEMVVPDVKLTRSRDGSNGVATFTFLKPTIFENDADIVSKGEITGLYMIDEEGELQTTDVLASFLDGKPNKIEATYVMKSAFQWDRFMRFMERYADANDLGFNKA